MLHAPIRRTTRLIAAIGATAAITISSPFGATAASAAPAAAASVTLTIDEAITGLPVTEELRDGYDRDLFRLWVDADGDGCNTRYEVLIAEADDPPTVGSRCSLTGGRWFSYYDRVSWTDPADIDIDHVVALAEAWDSGASQWDAGRREAYANDLDDYRTLVGVTDSVNQSKSDQDPAEWLPEYDQCRYLEDWLSVKVRWQLSVDAAELDALTTLAGSCDERSITVEIAP
jgi:Protein of unknown function (DUF1524)